MDEPRPARPSRCGHAATQDRGERAVVIFEMRDNPRSPDLNPAPPGPYTVLVNPGLTPLGRSRTRAGRGGLRLPGMRGLFRGFADCVPGPRCARRADRRTVEGFSTHRVCSKRSIPRTASCFATACGTCANSARGRAHRADDADAGRTEFPGDAHMSQRVTGPVEVKVKQQNL